MKHKRAPAGYRIVQWEDGFYHVYRGKWNCIEETTTKREAIETAWADKATQTPALPRQQEETK